MRTVLCWLFFIGGISVVTAANASSWNALYAFGDSYSDSGAGYVDINGPTAVVYLARGLNIPFTYSTDPDRAGKSLNFSVSGAKTGTGEGFQVSCKQRNEVGLLGRGIRNQINDFVARVRSGEIQFFSENTLFFIAGGLNDQHLPTEETVANLEAATKALYSVGARHIFVALLPTKIPPFSTVALRLNPALQRISEHIHLADLDLRLSHWGDYFDEVMVHAAGYGLTNTVDACAGRALFDEDPAPRGDPSTYYYFHDGHPSTAVHRVVGDRLLREALTAVQ